MDAVVIDANTVVDTDWQMRGVPWRLLRHRGRERLSALIMPEVVVREILGRHRTQLRSTHGKIRTASQIMGALGAPRSVPEVSFDDIGQAFERDLRARLEDALVWNPDPPITLLDLAERAIARRRPFNDNGNGFRDAIIWEHVIEAAEPAHITQVMLITNDDGFGKGGHLLPDLARDFASRTGGRTKVALMTSIDQYIASVGVEDPTLSLEVFDLAMARHDQIVDDLTSAMLGLSIRELDGSALLSIETVHDPVWFRVDRVSAQEGSDLALVEMSVAADADFSLELFDDDMRHVGSTTTFSFEATASYDRSTKDLGDIVLGEPGLAVDLSETIYRYRQDWGW